MLELRIRMRKGKELLYSSREFGARGGDPRYSTCLVIRGGRVGGGEGGGALPASQLAWRSPVHHSTGRSAHTHTAGCENGPGTRRCAARRTSVQAVALLLWPSVQRKERDAEKTSANKAVEGFKWVDGHMVGVSRSDRAPPGRFLGPGLE